METDISEKVMTKEGLIARQFSMKFLSSTFQALSFETINKSCAT